MYVYLRVKMGWIWVLNGKLKSDNTWNKRETTMEMDSKCRPDFFPFNMIKYYTEDAFICTYAL